MGPRCRRFEPCHLDHVGASFISLAPTFLKVRARSCCCSSFSAKSHAVPTLFACKRAHNASACYQLFAGAPSAQGIFFVPGRHAGAKSALLLLFRERPRLLRLFGCKRPPTPSLRYYPFAGSLRRETPFLSPEDTIKVRKFGLDANFSDFL